MHQKPFHPVPLCPSTCQPMVGRLYGPFLLDRGALKVKKWGKPRFQGVFHPYFMGLHHKWAYNSRTGGPNGKIEPDLKTRDQKLLIPNSTAFYDHIKGVKIEIEQKF